MRRSERRAAAQVIQEATRLETERRREEVAARKAEWWETVERAGIAMLADCVLYPSVDVADERAKQQPWVFVPAGSWRVRYFDLERFALEYRVDFPNGSSRWEIGVFMRSSVAFADVRFPTEPEEDRFGR